MDEDEVAVEDNDEDGSDEADQKDPEAVDGKKKRRRKRRRGNAKKKPQMLCREDILERLSDSSREEYLLNVPSPPIHTRSVIQSVFVSNSYAANLLHQSKRISELQDRTDPGTAANLQAARPESNSIFETKIEQSVI